MISDISLVFLTTYGSREFVAKRIAPPKGIANASPQMESIAERTLVTGAIKKEIELSANQTDDAPVGSETKPPSCFRNDSDIQW